MEFIDHDSRTTFLNDLSWNQQSRTQQGFGPQSTMEDLNMIGQWSEKFLSKINWVLPCHLLSHSIDTIILSSLLLVVSFGLCHVYFLSTHDTSLTSKSAIHSLNSFTILSSYCLWLIPTLSDGLVMLLKSPNIHHGPPKLAFLHCLICPHKFLFKPTAHNE